jgi:precorrin-8X/cobalt-precorrin-8 methylmutase
MDRTKARGLALIDRQIDHTSLAPAEYEIIRQVILATGDIDYRALIRFSPRSLETGAAALAARSPIIVDIPMVQAGIVAPLGETFVNLVYSCSYTIPDRHILSLARTYPDGIFVIGRSTRILMELSKAIDQGICKPALIIATPAGFIETHLIKDKLPDLPVPSIYTDKYKGGETIAVAIFNALLALAWQAYR